MPFSNLSEGQETLAVLPSTSPTKEFQPVDVLPHPFSGNSWFSLYLHNRDILASLVVEHVPQRKYYVINKLDSPVVEFSRSILEGRVMHPGRIWAQFEFLDKNRMIMLPKEPSFKSWYEMIARWLRKNFERVREGQYKGPGFQRLIRQGGTLAEM